MPCLPELGWWASTSGAFPSSAPSLQPDLTPAMQKRSCGKKEQQAAAEQRELEGQTVGGMIQGGTYALVCCALQMKPRLMEGI